MNNILFNPKQHRTMRMHWSQFVPNMSTDIRGHEAPLHHHQRGWAGGGWGGAGRLGGKRGGGGASLNSQRRITVSFYSIYIFPNEKEPSSGKRILEQFPRQR